MRQRALARGLELISSSPPYTKVLSFFARKRTLRFLLFLVLSAGYWAQSAPTYDLEGLSTLARSSLPVLLIIFRVSFVVILLVILPLVKGINTDAQTAAWLCVCSNRLCMAAAYDHVCYPASYLHGCMARVRNG